MGVEVLGDLMEAKNMHAGSTKNLIGHNHWNQNHIPIFDSVVKAITEMLPPDKENGLEIMCGSVSFLATLGIPRWNRPCCSGPRSAARGIELKCEEMIPYPNLSLNYVLLAYCDGLGDDLNGVFKEAHRVLKTNGMLIVAFIDSKSPAGEKYILCETGKTQYDTEKIIFDLTHAGFKHFEFCQTLFSDPGDLTKAESPREGYGEGAFVVVQARKKVSACMR